MCDLRRAFDLLDCYDLSIDETLKVTALRGGIENQVYLAGGSSGAYVLREYRDRTRREVLFEASILKRLAGRVEVATPHLELTRKGSPVASSNGALATLHCYLPGRPPTTCEPTLLDSLCRFVRNFWAVTQDRPWDGGVKSFRLRRVHAMARRLAQRKRSPQILLAQIRTELDWFPLYERVLARYPDRLIHADLVPSNVLVDACGELCAVLDFDDAYVESAVFEICAIARGFCFAPGALDVALLEQLRVAAEPVLGSLPAAELLLALRYVCFRQYVYIYYRSLCQPRSFPSRPWAEDYSRWRVVAAQCEAFGNHRP